MDDAAVGREADLSRLVRDGQERVCRVSLGNVKPV
jgi:hypothetical protein